MFAVTVPHGKTGFYVMLNNSDSGTNEEVMLVKGSSLKPRFLL